MEIIARKKSKNRVIAKDHAITENAETFKLNSKTYNVVLSEHIAVRINTTLYNILTNYITSAHIIMDYKYQSVSDIIRAALQKFKEGMHLTEIDEKKQGIQLISTTIRIDNELKQFWETLPDRNRRRILERAIRTYLKEIS